MTAPPLRIGVLLDRWQAPGGGLEAWLRAVAGAWAEQGHAVHLIARDADDATPAGMRAIAARSPWPLPRPWRDRLDAAARRRAAAALAPDALLDLRASLCPGAVWFAMGGAGAERDARPPSARRRALLRLEADSIACAAAAVAPSAQVAASIRALRADLPIHLLPLPLLAPVPAAPGPDPDLLTGARPARVVFCGRDPGRHGLDAALTWFAALRQRLPRAELHLWSRPRALDAVRRRADPAVHAHDWDDGFRAFLARADLLLHPTAYDSFSLVCLEAAAAGVPVLTTEAAGAVACLPPELCARAPRADAAAAGAAALTLLRAAAALPPARRADLRAALHADHDLGRHAARLAAILAQHRWTSPN